MLIEWLISVAPRCRVTNIAVISGPTARPRGRHRTPRPAGHENLRISFAELVQVEWTKEFMSDLRARGAGGGSPQLSEKQTGYSENLCLLAQARQLRWSDRCSPDFAIFILRISGLFGSLLEWGQIFSEFLFLCASSGSCSNNAERVRGSGSPRSSIDMILRTVQQPPTGGEIRESSPLLVVCPWRSPFSSANRRMAGRVGVSLDRPEHH